MSIAIFSKSILIFALVSLLMFCFSLDRYRNMVRESIPAGRGGEVEDVAPVIAFLISDENTYVTGTDIQVDGGVQWNMKAPNWGE